jgi:hypothetical protein
VDDGTQTKAFLEAGLWDAAGWLIATLSAGVIALMKRSWRQQETRLTALETACGVEHKQRQHDLNQHAVADSRSHDDIRKELATELKLVYAKIDSSNSAGEARADALSSQMTTQHGQITARVDKILELMIEGGK